MLVTQRNAWIHLAATVIVAGAAWFYEVGAVGWALLVLAMAAVWTAEALNTALELLADATSPSFHPLVGKAKDVAAGAVLVVALAAVVIGALVLWPAISSS
jgi:diacylglycerol kinase (ATP)